MQRQQWRKNGKKLEKVQAWQQDEVRSKKGGYPGSTKKDKKQSPLCYTDGHLSPQEYEELEPKFQKYRGRVVLCGDIVKDDYGAYAVFF